MYVPRPFRIADDEVEALLATIRAGHLITATAAGLVATLIPFVFDAERGTSGALLGHLARLNDQWQRPVIGEAMVLVQGPEGYISPTWYASKAEHGRVVPTWDYVALQIHGTLTVRDDVDFVRHVVTALTEKFEAASARPWQVTDAPADYIDRHLQAIVGVELTISRVDASAKLSQNRRGDIDGVVRGLRDRGADALADAVETHRTVAKPGDPT